MKTKITHYFLCVSLIILSGCGAGVNRFEMSEKYSPSTGKEASEEFTPPTWKKIVVLPFSGDPRFQKMAGEWFAYRIHNQAHYSIVPPNLAAIELQKKGMSPPEQGFDLEKAQQAGRVLEADAVVIGKIGVVVGVDVPAVANIQLVDAQTGEVVVSSITKDPVIARWGAYLHAFVVGSLDQAAKDLLVVLNGLAKGKVVKPKREPPSSEEESETEHLY